MMMMLSYEAAMETCVFLPLISLSPKFCFLLLNQIFHVGTMKKDRVLELSISVSDYVNGQFLLPHHVHGYPKKFRSQRGKTNQRHLWPTHGKTPPGVHG